MHNPEILSHDRSPCWMTSSPQNLVWGFVVGFVCREKTGRLSGDCTSRNREKVCGIKDWRWSSVRRKELASGGYEFVTHVSHEGFPPTTYLLLAYTRRI
ncbi:hypothetical protein KQX54_021480 [Cotesia glomerata]|uniref:Uncharacterized protein n=1 Tax=Cotesia glomerata TaxID=32391 RepID=A0AAV7J938_COTGL|nr:hypothetical protein KQX54_021480 [Cotesia glomerata]